MQYNWNDIPHALATVSLLIYIFATKKRIFVLYSFYVTKLSQCHSNSDNSNITHSTAKPITATLQYNNTNSNITCALTVAI